METKTTRKDVSSEGTSFSPDLLCEIHGRKERIQYAQGKDLNPIGFFPLEDNVYLLFEHSSVIPRRCVRIERKPVLSMNFWAKIYKHKNRINEFLAQMGKPLLNKKFFASAGIGEYNWIVDFSANSANMEKDFFDDTHKAVYVPWGEI